MRQALGWEEIRLASVESSCPKAEQPLPAFQKLKKLVVKHP